MNDVVLYILESVACLVILYGLFFTLFRHETYFGFNRFYLLISVVLSQLIPFFSFELQEREFGSLAKPIQQLTEARSYYSSLVKDTGDEWAQGDFLLSTQSEVFSDVREKQQQHSTSSSILLLLATVYGVGVLVFLSRFLYLFLWLRKLKRTGTTYFYERFRVVEIAESLPPFSFISTIYTNSSGLNEKELNKVLMHEKAHIQQFHSIDLLIVQLLLIVQWFNPLLWMIRNDLRHIHEYLADRQVIREGMNVEDYQSLLLTELVGRNTLELTNHFNLLSTKKRISMMNKSKSGLLAQAKIVFTLPALFVSILLFSDCSKNDADAYLDQMQTKNALTFSSDIELPDNITSLNSVRLDDNLISIYNDKVWLNQEEVNYVLLQNWLEGYYQKHEANASVVLEIDKNASMKEVDKLFGALREAKVLNVAYLAKGNGNETLALFQQLPFSGITMNDIQQELIKREAEQFLFSTDHLKNKSRLSKLIYQIFSIDNYLMTYVYDSNDTFQTYLSAVDLVYVENQRKREEYAEQQFNRKFNELNQESQKDVRKKYPVALFADCVK